MASLQGAKEWGRDYGSTGSYLFNPSRTLAWAGGCEHYDTQDLEEQERNKLPQWIWVHY